MSDHPFRSRQCLHLKSRLRFGIGLAAFATALPMLAAAAEAAASSSVSEIVVTANKKSERLSQVGVGISAISGDALEKLNANTLEDYLQFIPGVSFTSFGRPGQNQITIRGIAALGLGPAIATYVDEVPVGSTSNEAQGSNYTPDIDPADLDHVEVLKGPQGTLYGASSLGGLIKYVTKAPSLSASELNVGAEVNDVDHGDVGYKFRVAGTAPIIKDVLGIRLSGFYRRDAGYIDNGLTGAQNINSDRAYGVRGSVLYEPTPALQIKLSAVYQKTDANGLDAVSYNTPASPPPPFTATHGDLNQYLHLAQPNNVRDQIYSAEIHYDFGWATLVSATGFSAEDIYRFTDVTGTYTRPSYMTRLHEPVGSTASLVNDYNIRKDSEEVRLQSRANGKFEWIVGGIYQDERSKTDGFVDIRDPNGALLPQPAGMASFSNTSNDLEEYAGFVDATYYLVPRLDISAGYRRSHLDQTNSTVQSGYVFEPATPTVPITRTDTPVNDVNTYSIGLRWRPTDNLLFYGRAASGFRPGGGRGQPPLVIPNFVFTYNPDSVWSYEAGVKAKAWDGRIVLDVDGFWINWKDIQTLIPAVAGQPYLINGNAGTAVSRGAEGQVQVTPMSGLTLTAALSYTDAHFTETVAGVANNGDQLAFVAKFTGSLQAEYEHAITDSVQGFIGGDYSHRSSMIDALGFRMPGYGQGGLHAGVQRGSTRISAFVVNVTDTRGLLGYTGGGNQATDPYRYAVNPPRTVGLNVTQKF